MTGMCAITKLFTQYNYNVFSEIMPLNAHLDCITHEFGFLHAIFKNYMNTSVKYLQENIVMVGPVLIGAMDKCRHVKRIVGTRMLRSQRIRCNKSLPYSHGFAGSKYPVIN